MQLLPISDYLIVSPLETEDYTDGGVLLAQHVESAVVMGIVIAIGPGRYNRKGYLIPTSVRPGQIVFFNQFAGMRFLMFQENLIILREEYVTAYSKTNPFMPFW